MLVDIHAHTSNRHLWGLFTAQADIPNLEHETAQYGVTTVVLMATYFPLKGRGLSNKELLARIAGRPLFRMFGSLDMETNFESGLLELSELAEAGQIKGIKLYPGYQLFDPEGPRAFKVYGLARQYQLPVMFHGGELHGCCPRDQRDLGANRCGQIHCPLPKREVLSSPSSMARAFERFPEVRFTVSHLANPHFAELLTVMQRYLNVSTDISGQFVSGSAEDTPEYRAEIVCKIKEFLRLPNGAERLMFGTDYPIQSYADSLDLVARLKLGREEEELVLWRNAERFLEGRK